MSWAFFIGLLAAAAHAMDRPNWAFPVADKAQPRRRRYPAKTSRRQHQVLYATTDRRFEESAGLVPRHASGDAAGLFTAIGPTKMQVGPFTIYSHRDPIL
jgi:hypothetical protein